MEFNGNLTIDQIYYLKSNGVSEKKIELIQTFLKKYQKSLTDYVDLVGRDLKPGDLFYFNMKHFGHLLDLESDKTFSKNGIKIRSKFTQPLIQKLGPSFLHSKQIFEDRNELLSFSMMKKEFESCGIYQNPTKNQLEFEKDKGITLPESPAIWTLNHHFKDDVLASVISVKRPFYMFFGSIPQFYNTFDGVLAYLIGSIIVNRKSKESRIFGQKKAEKAIDMGLDLLWAPEGVWNKNPHILVEHLWPGFYRVAKETGAKVIPIVHYIKDPTQIIDKKSNPIHTVIDDPVDLSYMPEREALEYYRDILASWYYIMAEKYGQSTRKEIIGDYNNSFDAYENEMANLMRTVDRYDIEFEKTGSFCPKHIVKPEDVFESISKIQLTPESAQHKLYAEELVRVRRKENFQSRY